MGVRSRQHRSAPAGGRGYRLWIGGPVPPGADAITIGRTIIARRRVASSPTFERLLRHELTHVEQWRQLGHVRFLRRYVGEYIAGRTAGLRHHDAYLNISLERAARERASDKTVAHEVTLSDVCASHRRAEQLVNSLSDADLLRPSSLPGWTVGHVIAHVLGNAHALSRVAVAVAAGEPATLYDSFEGRAAGIETLRGLALHDLANAIHTANAAFESAWGSGRNLSSLAAMASAVPGSEPFPVSTGLHRRLREVEVHLSDCGDRRFTYDMWSDQFVDAELAEQWPHVAERVAEPVHFIDERGLHHTTAGGVQSAAVYLTRRSIVAWLLGRYWPTGCPEIAPW